MWGVTMERKEIFKSELRTKKNKAWTKRFDTMKTRGKAMIIIYDMLWKKEVSELKPEDLVKINTILYRLVNNHNVSKRWIYDNCDIKREKLDKCMANFSWWRAGKK